VALVFGADDRVSPVAKSEPSSTLAGMPIQQACGGDTVTVKAVESASGPGRDDC
jgi:NAD/NADP transhydrogenase beta subunit